MAPGFKCGNGNKDMKKLKDVLKIRKSAWMKLGIFIKKWITTDAMVGVVQGKQRPYKSQSYKDYKSRGMRRKTDGKLLKSMNNHNPKNTLTKNVNMMLTGRLFKGLKPVSSTYHSVTMSYNASDADKIEGAEDNGTNIRTLSPKNQRNVKKEIMIMLDKPIKEYVNEKIIIKA